VGKLINREVFLGMYTVNKNLLLKTVVTIVLVALTSTANAVTVTLVSHSQTSGGGTISTLITDGSHVSGIAAASTAVWNWDGATLTATGLYSNVASLTSSPFSSTILSDQIIDLTIDTSTGTGDATSYSCIEGTFLSTVGANGCGGYDFGVNFIDESTTTWGPGTATSQTIGGDDVLSGGGPRNITAYNFGDALVSGTGLHTGDELMIGNGIALGTVDPLLGGGKVMLFSLQTSAVDDAVNTNLNQVIDISVLANDVLADSLGEDIVDLQVATGPLNGATVVNGALPGPRAGLSISYTPDFGFLGEDTFDYTVTDLGATPVTATVIVTVTNQVDAIDDGTPIIPFGSVLAGQVIILDILANDSGLSATPLSLVTPVNMIAVLGSTIAIGSPGSASTIRISYTAGLTPGIDSFDYQISDNNGSLDNATVYIEVFLDDDNDGIKDSIDNCLGAANPDQTDADGDGYGNWCDADFTNDGIVNFGDLAALRTNFGTADAVTDLTSDGVVNFADLARFRALFGKPPGPSALVP
jgi:hypothetical protein